MIELSIWIGEENVTSYLVHFVPRIGDLLVIERGEVSNLRVIDVVWSLSRRPSNKSGGPYTRDVESDLDCVSVLTRKEVENENSQ